MKKLLLLIITSLLLTGCGDSMNAVTWSLAKDLCTPFGGLRSATATIQMSGNRIVKAYCIDMQTVEKFYSGATINKLSKDVLHQ